jgi:hypothetical protein
MEQPKCEHRIAVSVRSVLQIAKYPVFLHQFRMALFFLMREDK